jgi:peptidoglycan/LPS O-acetylase OafA/YrhL
MTSIVAPPPPKVTGNVTGHDPAYQLTVRGPRIHYFDWLRAIAVLGIVVYHALLPFASPAWFIRNREQSDLLMAVLSVFQTFGLPVLFLVAGASARFALQTRPVRAFLAERAARLLVPFVVGSLLMGPPVGYVSGLHNGTWSGSFLAFVAAYPRIVLGYNPDAGFSPVLLVAFGVHLWFLAWLFLYAALGAPLFAFLSSARGRPSVDALGRLARWRGATLLFAAPITLPILALYAHGVPGRLDWWAFGWFGVVFVVGYLLYSDDRLLAAARRDRVPALVAAVLGSVALSVLDFPRWAAQPQSYSATYFLMLSLSGLTGWAWTLALLGLGMRAGFMQRPLPAYAAEGTLPLYILHLPIVVAFSFLVVGWPLGLRMKILVNVALGLGASLLAAAAAFRLPVLPSLLGLRRKRSSVAEPRPAARHHSR